MIILLFICYYLYYLLLVFLLSIFTSLAILWDMTIAPFLGLQDRAPEGKYISSININKKPKNANVIY